MQIKQICRPIQDKLNKLLLAEIPCEKEPLYEAARYCFENGGKRLRPLLTLLVCRDLGGDMEAAYDAALALEMIHNYSLIHDDLPCMDDDDFRRGKATLHKAFDEATAVLCGDFLFTHAFSLLANSKNLKPEQKLKLISLLSYYAGGKELLAGQSLDLNMEGKKGTLEDLNQIYLKKTACLFCCALEFAAVLAGSSLEVQSNLKAVGKKMGLVFQLQNDFLGQKKDQKLNKFTIFSLLTHQQAKLLQKKYFEEALESLSQCELSCVHLKNFFLEMMHHEV